VSAALYRVLLRAFPRSFRRRFGPDMAELFADQLRHAHRRGAWAVLGLWCTTVFTVTRHAAEERRAQRRGDAPSAYLPITHNGASMSAFVMDLMWAARGLWRRPGFTIAAAAMLAIGLGFNTALFAVVNAVVLRPLPYPQADQIVMVWTGLNPDGTGANNSYADYLSWKERTHSLDLAAYNVAFGTFTDESDPEQLGGAVVSPEFFRILGARMALGRGIGPGDELVPLDAGRPIVIAHGLWMRRFHGDPNIIGRSVVVNDYRRTIVGVLGEEFQQPEITWDTPTQFWLPLVVAEPIRSNRAFHYLRVIGRLKNGVSVAAARTEMDGVGKQLMAEFPVTNTDTPVVRSVHDELVGDTRPLLGMFLGAVSLVFLLAIANIINMLLARASGRRAELSVRTALGASRGRLVSQLVAESTLIGLIGGAAGLLFASASLTLVIRYGRVTAPGIETASIDGATLIFATLFSGLTGAVSGLIPALRMVRAKAASSSVSEMRGSSGPEAAQTRRWLVAVETALAVPLLVGAVLLTQTLVNMQHVNPGFDAARVLQFRITLSGARYDTSDKQVAFFDQLRASLAQLSNVNAVGIVSSLPLGGLNNTGATFNYRKPDGTIEEIGAGFRAVGGDYFTSLGIPVIAGRTFTDTDRGVTILNDVAVREMWGDRNPIGEQVRFGNDTTSPWLTVVGVVGSVRHETLTQPAAAEMFRPYRDDPWTTMTVTVRTSGDPLALAPAARATVAAIDPRLPLAQLGSAAMFIDNQLARPRFGVICAAVFGLIGLALAAFGTFAVLSLLVAQRSREIGIRMALGATRARVSRLMLSQSLIPAAIGCTAGGIGAALLARLLGSQLFGVTSHDPTAFSLAIGGLTIAAGLASWWPTRRATRIDPARALRN
jgi:putative ABC transport system permease protein